METDRIISKKEFRKLTGLSRSSEWRLGREGRLPTVIKMNDSWVLGYRYSDYLKWLESNSK